MQLIKLAALLPALLLISASPLSPRKEPYTPVGAPGGGLSKDQRDGTFKVFIEGQEQYEGDLGNLVLGHFHGREALEGEYYLIPRLKVSNRNHQEQTFGAVLALKGNLDTAIIECSVVTTGAIPDDMIAEVVFDVKDPANPTAKAMPEGGPFKDVGCKLVNIGIGH